MLQKRRSTTAASRRVDALVFAALGDATRLGLLVKLARGRPCSISQLTKDSRLTRQAISKHLRVLQSVGIVHSVKTGRENRFEFSPQPIKGIQQYLEFVSQQWDQALFRLKFFAER